MQVPSWFRCENCIFWAFSREITYYSSTTLEELEITGCIHPSAAPQLHSCTYRCPMWICRRCLMSFENIVANAPDIENHNFCKKAGRGKKNKNACGFVEEDSETVVVIPKDLTNIMFGENNE